MTLNSYWYYKYYLMNNILEFSYDKLIIFFLKEIEQTKNFIY